MVTVGTFAPQSIAGCAGCCTGPWVQGLQGVLVYQYGCSCTVACRLRCPGDRFTEPRRVGAICAAKERFNCHHMGGASEHLDVLGAVNWLHRLKGYPMDRIGLAGWDMGGDTVSVAASLEPRLRSIWVDSPPCDMRRTIEHALSSELGSFVAQMLIGLIYDLVKAKLDSPALFDITASASNTFGVKQSLGVVTTRDDTTVPSEFTAICAAAAQESDAKGVNHWEANLGKQIPTEFRSTGLDTHMLAFLYVTKWYKKKLLDFFTEGLNPVQL